MDSKVEQRILEITTELKKNRSDVDIKNGNFSCIIYYGNFFSKKEKELVDQFVIKLKKRKEKSLKHELKYLQEKHRDGGSNIDDFRYQPNFPKNRKDYSESTGHVKQNVLSVIGILLMFSSIFIGAYGEQVIWTPNVYVPISFSVFLLSINILIKCLK